MVGRYKAQYTGQVQIVTGRHDPPQNPPLLMHLISVLQHQKYGQTIQFIQCYHRKLTEQSSMNQLRQALKRIFAVLEDKQRAGSPYLFSKLDIKDGLWRMIVNDKNAWNFYYTLPPQDPEASADNLCIVLPNSLQTGWRESPPFFYAATETTQYVTQIFLHTKLPPHKSEEHIMPPPQEAATDVDVISDIMYNVTLLEVFVDDFIALTDDLTQYHLLQVSRVMLHGINTVFPLLEVIGHNGGDPIIEK